MSVFKTIDRISWRSIGFLSLTCLALTGWLVFQTSVSTPTRSTSQANVPTPPTAGPTPLIPLKPPIIDSLEYFYAKPGDAVRLRGQHFGSVSPTNTLSINSIPLSIIRWTDTQIDFTVPTQASSGPITLTVNGYSTLSPILSIYTDPLLDPQLQLDHNSTGYSLILLRAPKGAHLTMGTLGTYPIVSSPQVLLTASTPILVNHATLIDTQGNLLPLYIDVPSQTLMR